MEHAVAAIVEAESCRQSSFAKRKVRLSNVLFENNTNLGGSVGLVVRDPFCRGAVELRDVAFEGNEYSKASVLARENTLANVSVVANRKITNKYNRKTHFFHFPNKSLSTVTNMTATGNANAPVLYVERGNLNVSSSLFQNNTGKYNTVVRVLSSSLTMHETRFLNNESERRIVAVAAVKTSSIYFSSCTFVGNVGGKKSSGIVSASTPREISFLHCDFVDNVLNSFSAATVLLEGSGPPVTDETRQNTSANFKHCTFLRNECFYVTAVRIVRFYNNHSVLFDSCEVRGNRWPVREWWEISTLSAAIQLEESTVQNFTTKNCTFQSNTNTSNVLLFYSVYGTVWITNASFADNRTPVNDFWITSVLGVLNGGISERARDVEQNFILRVVDSDFKRNGGEFTGSAVHVSDDLARVVVRNCLFLDNRAERGAAVLVERVDDLFVDNCTFTQNKANNGGGAIRFEDSFSSFLEVFNSTFTRNEGHYGGAVDVAGRFTVLDSNFSENRARTRGGAIRIGSSEVFDPLILRSIFTRNEGQFGGAIDAMRGVSVEDSRFRRNRANSRGGAMNFECPEDDRSIISCDFNVEYCSFTKNRATRSGGALQVNAASRLNATRCTFRKNNATFGGGISFFRGVDTPQNTVEGSGFTENNAEMGGETQKTR